MMTQDKGCSETNDVETPRQTPSELSLCTGDKAAEAEAPNSAEEMVEDKEDTTPTPAVPYGLDRGYAWFVVLGSFLTLVVVGGFERVDGVLLIQFQSRFERSTQLTTWVITLVSSMRLAMGPVTSALCSMYSVRTVVMVGSLIHAVALVLDGFTPNFWFLIVSHTVMQGFSRGLLYASALIVLTQYFNKRLSLATGLGSSGVGIGTICIVPFTQFCFDTFGFQGTFLILAGVTLNGLISAMLFRPLSMHEKFIKAERKRKMKYAQTEEAETETLKDGTTPVDPTPHSYDPLMEKQPSAEMDVPSSTAESTTPRHRKKDGCCMSSIKICFPVEEGKRPEGTTKNKLCHFYLLKDPTFLLFCLTMGLFTAAFKIAFTFIPALVISKGLTEADAAWVLSITGILDTFSRIATGLILSSKKLRPLLPVICNAIVFGIAAVSFTFPFLTSFDSLSCFCALYGTLTGAFVSQKSVVVIDMLDESHKANSFGIMIFFQSLGITVGPPVSGALRDAFGSFDEAFFFGGGCLVISGFLMVGSNMFLRAKTRKVRQQVTLEFEIE